MYLILENNDDIQWQKNKEKVIFTVVVFHRFNLLFPLSSI